MDKSFFEVLAGSARVMNSSIWNARVHDMAAVVEMPKPPLAPSRSPNIRGSWD